MCITGLQAKAGSWAWSHSEWSNMLWLRKGCSCRLGLLVDVISVWLQAGPLPIIMVVKVGTQAGPQGEDMLGTHNL